MASPEQRRMASLAVHQFAHSITCHAWSPDHSMMAFCPNSNEVHIYRLSEENWDRTHVLQKHDQIVCGIDWSAKSNRIVTVSHDRSSYVWHREGSEWVPTLVVLRLNRAALCVQWSPKENKIAVGSGAKTVCICYYDQDNNWWVSKLISEMHISSVTSVAWHPNNKDKFGVLFCNYQRRELRVAKNGYLTILVATASTDGKCRVFSTFIKGVDTKPEDKAGSSSGTKFGEQIMLLDLSDAWAFGVKWSPNGKTLAYAGHNSMIYFVHNVGPSPVAQNIALKDLPLRDVLFLSERLLVGVGFDCSPMVFAANERGNWSFIRFLDERKTSTSGSKSGSHVYLESVRRSLRACLNSVLNLGQQPFHLLSEAFGKLYHQSKHGMGNDAEAIRQRGTVHENCINCIVPLELAGQAKSARFSTSGLDGRIVIWDLESQEDLTAYLDRVTELEPGTKPPVGPAHR